MPGAQESAVGGAEGSIQAEREEEPIPTAGKGAAEPAASEPVATAEETPPGSRRVACRLLSLSIATILPAARPQRPPS